MRIILKYLNFFIIFVLIINSLITQYFIMLIYLYCLSRLVQLMFLHIFTKFQGIWMFFYYKKCIIIDYNEFINNSILYYTNLFILLRKICSANVFTYIYQVSRYLDIFLL